MRIYKGKIEGKGLKLGVVVSRFNDFITQKLLEGAIDALIRHGVREEDIEVVWVPGGFEIPAVASHLIKEGNFDALICLGAVIRGDTPHYELISTQVAKGIANLSVQAKIPVIFGVVTADTIEQAIERAGTKEGNKGFDAAFGLLEMIDLYAAISAN